MNYINKLQLNNGIFIRLSLLLAVILPFQTTYSNSEERINKYHNPRFVILMISDGWGIKHIEATNKYKGYIPSYQKWEQYWMSTYPAGGGYDPEKVWADFEYIKKSSTDSASSATALYTGNKTTNGMISVSVDSERLFSITDKSKILNMSIGAVSTVPLSHATPGAWVAHNDNRFNSYAIAEEGLFGNPQSTRNEWTIYKKIRNRFQNLLKFWPRLYNKLNDKYEGGHGDNYPTADVLIGSRGFGFIGEKYINSRIMDRLANIDSPSDNLLLIKNQKGIADGGSWLIEQSNNPDITKLVGLFDHKYKLADGSGNVPEDPTLSEKTEAALNVLCRNKNGFVLMVEAGAVDWAGHANSMDKLIGEQSEFDDAVQEVINWVEDSTNVSNWDNTLVIVTGDHETGYLTAGPGIFPDKPLGEISDKTISLEKKVKDSDCRASWEDDDNNSEINNNEKIYWTWNTCGSYAHTNSLVPLYAKGLNSDLFDKYIKGIDLIRGPYIDNTDVYKVMDSLVAVQNFEDENGNKMAVVPRGEFWMGCDSKTDKNCSGKELQGRYVYIDTFAIDKVEVSVDQYGECVKAGICTTDGLNLPFTPMGEKPEWSFQCNWNKEGHGIHPINCVDWYQAKTYCEWAGKRLPTELEWEKAARGTDRRVYPWGNSSVVENVEFANLADETSKNNSAVFDYLIGHNDGFNTTAPVNSFVEGMSPYGLINMAGNVWNGLRTYANSKIKVVLRIA